MQPFVRPFKISFAELFSPLPPRRAELFVVLALALVLGGCSGSVRWLGIRLFYDETPIATERVVRDVSYRPDSELEKHRLDLFLPENEDGQGEGWPTLVFVHGGGWTAGDKSQVVAGADVYGNIGRFYASKGIGTAVINYRLQPSVTWREQVDDVAHAVAWVHGHVAEYGGGPQAIFLSGHSAGAQLSAFVALSPGPLAAVGLSPGVLCGVIPVSGVAYDLADAKTYELGAQRPYYEQRFQAGDPGDGWLTEASAVTYVSAAAPPFLLIHGSREWKSLRYQNRLLDRRLREAGAESRLVVGLQTHGSILLALSREDRKAGSAALDFIRGSSC